MLRLTLLHAMHVLGDEAGTAGLQAYLTEPRAALRIAAQTLLEA